MKPLLLSLQIFLIPNFLFAAEPIVYNDVEGVFLTSSEAVEARNNAIERKSLEKQKNLLQEEIKELENLKDLKDRRLTVEQKIAESWKLAFESAQGKLSEREAKDDVRFYIYGGLFTGGIIVGAAMMYGASVLLHNLD